MSDEVGVAAATLMLFSTRFFLWPHELEDDARRTAC